MVKNGLTDLLEDVAGQHPDDPSITFLGKTLIWDAFARRARKQGNALRTLGVGVGDGIKHSLYAESSKINSCMSSMIVLLEITYPSR